MLEPDQPRPGLRERKKAKTRASIQEQALRLFREHGYPETTVDQIAEAAEVSPSTFFRYFPTKEDVVLYDPFDPAVIEAIRAQPAGVSPIGAIRAGLRAGLAQAPREGLALRDERAALIFSVPELRMRMLDKLARTTVIFSEVIAERVGRKVDDITVRALVGAVIGVGLAIWFSEAGALSDDYLTSLDQGLAQLEAGLPL